MAENHVCCDLSEKQVFQIRKLGVQHLATNRQAQEWCWLITAVLYRQASERLACIDIAALLLAACSCEQTTHTMQASAGQWHRTMSFWYLLKSAPTAVPASCLSMSAGFRTMGDSKAFSKTHAALLYVVQLERDTGVTTCCLPTGGECCSVYRMMRQSCR
jgi:hypothetical protein